MSITSDLAKFLQAVFPDYIQNAFFAHAYRGTSWTEFREIEKLNDKWDCYLSSGVCPGPGITRKATIKEVWALVIDDVGSTGPSRAVLERVLGLPTFEVLTSKGSAHWWYVLEQRIPLADWPMFFAEIERRVGQKLHGPEAGHVFRIPFGLNTKTERDDKPIPVEEQNWPVQLGRHDLSRRLDTVGIMLFAEPVAAPSPRDPGETGRVWDVQGLMELIPNNTSYDEWMAHGFQLWAIAIDKDEARKAWLWWSEQWTGSGDKYSAESKWDGEIAVKGDSTRGDLLHDAAYKANPEKYREWLLQEGERPETAAVRTMLVKAFDDGIVKAEPPKPTPKSPLFEWIDHRSMPTRDWLYGRLLIRKFLSMTVAPGGAGKSSLIVTEALAQVTGRNLIGEKVKRPLRVWIWNLEDPYEEVQRRILAAAKHHGISREDIGDRLLVSGGRDQRLVLADMVAGKPTIMRAAVNELIERIKAYGVDVLVIDPFVSCHKLPENDNIAQDMIIKELNRVAEEGGCAVHIVDHVRKGPKDTEIDTLSARGAKAKTDAARVVRVINRMTDAEGKNIYGKSEPWKFIHAFHDKSNMAPPLCRREWFQLMNVNLENGGVQPGVGAGITTGDDVGVIDEWNPPSPTEMANTDSFQKVVEKMQGKRWRASKKSPDWIGEAVFAAVDPEKKLSRKNIEDILKVWFDDGLLQIVEEEDNYRNKKDFVVLGGKHKPVY